jgi:tetratricopeptide (TPR) repeat protein
MFRKESEKKHWAEYFKALQKHGWDKALIALRALRELEPENPQVHLRMGDLLRRTDDLGNAVVSYHQAAQCLHDKGFNHKAIAVYKIILKIDPDDSPAQDMLRETLSEMESPKPTAIEEMKPVAIQEEEQPTTIEEEQPTATEEEQPAAIEEEQPTELTSSLFRSLSNEEINALTAEAHHLSFGPGETVIKEGDVGNSIYVIKKGKALVSATLGGKTIQLALLESGDIFGEVAYLTGRPRTASVSTEGELEVMEIGNPALKDAIEKNPLILDTLEEFYSSRVQNTIKKLHSEQTKG